MLEGYDHARECVVRYGTLVVGREDVVEEDWGNGKEGKVFDVGITRIATLVDQEPGQEEYVLRRMISDD